MPIDSLVMVSYLLAMVAVGWWAARRAGTKSEFLVAGRRLGHTMYSGTMSAVVLGGASTVGGVRLGYLYGISGAWLVLTIGLGVLGLSLLFARRITRLKVYTVSEMLQLRYGGGAATISGFVMWVYALMLMVTSTIACSTIFGVLFGMDRASSVVLGGGIVVLYSVLGGMWSITLTDMVQFVVKTVGILFVLLPVAVAKAGGFDGLAAALPADYFSLWHIGAETILTYVLVYFFGLLIGQDIWQRVFTARDDKVATVGGTFSGLYCLLYAFAGAIVGMAAKALFPNLASPDDAFATIVTDALPTGLRGLVLAAALAAVMSTASGALIACATVASNDIWPRLRPSENRDEVRTARIFTLVLGIAGIAIASMLQDVVGALTVAYNLLVGGLLVPILGGLVWRRGTRQGALASIVVGGTTVVVLMLTHGMLANEPILWGLPISLVTYVAVSLATPPTEAAKLAHWQARLTGEPR
ncbi:sodium:solute symporter family protein [Allokutzneria albata]|uniref:Solute:Na+ symporter, SSS family n=1 Tax=Allokutzneria albata TaxID=211114 RepID=A0A1G9WKD7_ALLAB|nr:sodium:solute symporter [Allokutzneria albata]SDM84631.1 solute:Na+ symporter, SSS family [Allokutzneria albata]